MFFAQNLKKFLKETFQENKNRKGKINNEIGRHFLDDEDLGQKLGNDPILHSLVGNTWHGMFPGDD
jgi:hypothetical protein